MKLKRALICLSVALASSSVRADNKWDISKVDVSKLPPPAEKQGLTYVKDIRPLLQSSCLRCHGEDRQRGELRLDSLDAVLKGGKDGKVVVPGDSQSSLLVASIARIKDDIAMPPKQMGGGRGRPGGPPGGPNFGGGNGNPPPGSEPGGPPPRGGDPGGPPPGGPGPGTPPPGGGPGDPPPDHGGPGGPPNGPGGPNGPHGPGGPRSAPLTAAQVGLVRAWIDQGAK